MKALLRKELRENVKLAALGLIIYTILLVEQYRDYIASPTRMSQPLASEDLLWNTAWFCGIFGAVLGWLQIHNERRPDLWAFLMHRPMTRTGIFLGKAIAGLGLYALVAGIPLLAFTIWARLPGHVAAPFDPVMLLPVTACVLGGILYYFAGMLTGLRQARWYASRVLGLGVAIIVSLLMPFWPEHWQDFLCLLIGAGILATAAWGGFQSHGHYQGQPACGKAALTTSIMLGSLIVVVIAAALLGTFLAEGHRPARRFYYAQTVDGAVFKVTRGSGESSEIADLEGKPLNDAKTGRMIELSSFNRRLARATPIGTGQNSFIPLRQWTQPNNTMCVPWRATSDTLWYYWGRYGRLVGYDIATRRCIGSLGPNGFSQDLSGGGDRFSDSTERRGSRTLSTATTLYRVNLEARTTKPLFTTTNDDPILAATEIVLDSHDWEHTAVVTKRFIHLLTAEGKPVWKAPYEPNGPAYTRAEIFFLERPGQFALWIGPSYRAQQETIGSLTNHVMWLASDQGVVRSAELPASPPYRAVDEPEAAAVCAVAPPALLMMLPHLPFGGWLAELARGQSRISWAVAILVCVPIGLWLGRRYRFSFAAQAGWAVFHLLFGVPGLLAFLSVQEWPAREACPNCKRLRVVDRAQCEHCGADFAPPEKTGTEIFAPLEASP